MNKMKEIGIEKLTLNVGAGEAGAKLEKAAKMLQVLSGKKPIIIASKKRIPTWGIRPGLTIGTKVTLRGEEAETLIKSLLAARENLLTEDNFDNEGNVSFGIPEYIDIPGMEYIVEVGIIGLEASITLERPGFRVKKRKYQRKRIPKRHRITREEAIEFMKIKFKVILEVEE